MTRHTGLGRHSGVNDAAGDPLDGLVNLFDIGIVLAVAFLIAGLGLTLDQHTHSLQARASTTKQTQTLPTPSSSAPSASGHGQAVGTVYRLSNGQLIYVQKQR
jgi:hypothetical protein